MKKLELLRELAKRKMKDYEGLDFTQEHALYHNLGVFFSAEGHVLRALRYQLELWFGKYLLLKSQKIKPTYINAAYLGDIAYIRKQYKSAIRWYQAACDIQSTWVSEYSLCLSLYKDRQIQKALLKTQKLYDDFCMGRVAVRARNHEKAFCLVESFYLLLLAEVGGDPLSIRDEDYIFENCDMDCGLYIGYFLKNDGFTHRYLHYLLDEKPGIIFRKVDYALMVDCILKTNDEKLLETLLSLYSEEDDPLSWKFGWNIPSNKRVTRHIQKLLKSSSYRKQQLKRVQQDPERVLLYVMEHYILEDET